MKEIHVLDAARQRFMHHQQAVRESELNRLDHEVQKRVVQREEETKHVLEDIETRALELERQKALLEQELAKCQEEVRKSSTDERVPSLSTHKLTSTY